MSDPPVQAQNLAQRVRIALRHEELSTLDALFLLGCRRGERHLARIQTFDWSKMPRSLEFGLGDTQDLNCDQIREAGRAFLFAAIDDLLELNGRSGTELEVLRAMRRRLEGVPAQQLGEELETEPLRRRDPKTYRNWIVAYGYEQIRDWAQDEAKAASETQVVPPAEPAPEPRPVPPTEPAPGKLAEESAPRRWPSFLRWAALLGSVAVVAAIAGATVNIMHERAKAVPGTVTALDAGTGSVLIPVNLLGLNLNASTGGTVPSQMETVIPRKLLPNLGSALATAVLVPKDEALRAWPDALAPLDSAWVALGTQRAGTHSGHVTLWDPATDTLIWDYEFVQRPGEADMNPDLPPDAGAEQYRVAGLAHSSPFGSLGPERIVAIFQQKFSPCFVVILDLATGEELARYASYGTLYDPLIMDIDQDGDVEIVLAGTDNACDAPTLTVLDPEMSDGATSSVGWNTEGEGALWRVILPDPRAMFEDYFASYEIAYWPGSRPPRLHTHDLHVRAWDPRTGRLALSVGPSQAHHVYAATLVHGLPDYSVPIIRLGDSAEQVWRSMGLDPSKDPDQVAMRAIVIEQGDGYLCPEGMEKVGFE
jgi:hypothetical protein